MTHNTQHTYGRIPLKEGSARRRDLYLTDNIHKRQTSMPPTGIRNRKPRKWMVSEWRFKLRGHWNG